VSLQCYTCRMALLLLLINSDRERCMSMAAPLEDKMSTCFTKLQLPFAYPIAGPMETMIDCIIGATAAARPRFTPHPIPVYSHK